MKLLLENTRLLMCIALITPCWFDGSSQNTIAVKVNNKDRVYLSTQTKGSSPNQPLIIILHSNKSTALATFRNEEFWKRLQKPVTILFPMAAPDNWHCDEGVEDDVKFLRKIIEDAYDRYLINRSRVFIIAVDKSYCIAEVFRKKNKRMVKAIAPCNEFGSAKKSILEKSDSLLHPPKR